MLNQAEYIWLDGTEPTQELRSKTRILDTEGITLEDFPEWAFDGSSTAQSPGENSDLVLKPVSFVDDPIRGEGNYLVMCEVFTPDGEAHPTNHRATLRSVLDAGGSELGAWFGFEQEYTLFEGSRPLGWPEVGYPAPQGPFYCGVGSDKVYGREIVEAHTALCLKAGLMIFGTNAEVMPGQWEFQMGYRGVEGESADPLTVTDHLWFARWLLNRVGEDFGVAINYEVKPVKGDWNGAGAHTNFSTTRMRHPETGAETIENAVAALKEKHGEHIAVYGAHLEERLTGLHETCSITEFKSGTSDRGASIRIPLAVAKKGYGYIEDRRPGANCNPYQVAYMLVKTVAGL